ncbi:hypothetical protein PROP_03068 [Propionicimonas sp. T2.31MG-18]|uniref:VOC family protein n=1 Tax=Propionicimonas sp. T2.31MG-18 TaxID=3157620 RepID=UPI0035EE12BC
MKVQSITICLRVSDLARSVEWYRTALDLDEPDLEPAEGVVEFKVGAVWLQLVSGDLPVPGAAVVRLGVPDVAAERARLRASGVAVGPLEQVEGVLEYFEFPDPDGNLLGLYAEVEP